MIICPQCGKRFPGDYADQVGKITRCPDCAEPLVCGICQAPCTQKYVCNRCGQQVCRAHASLGGYCVKCLPYCGIDTDPRYDPEVTLPREPVWFSITVVVLASIAVLTVAAIFWLAFGGPLR